MNKLLTISLLTATLLYVGAGSTLAQYYGNPTPGSEVSINKLVKNPQNGQMVDNLGSNDPKFVPSQDVTFQIKVTNTGDTELTNLIVKDQLPNFVDFVSGGSFDSGSQVITINVDKLAVNETKTFEVKAKVKNADQVPANQVTCVANLASVTVNSLSAQDTAQFCFETTVTKGGPVLPGVTTLPKTGVADVLATVALTLGSALAGIYVWLKRSFR